TQRIPVGVINRGKPSLPPAPVAAVPVQPVAKPMVQGPVVSLRIMSLASQIPTQVFSVQGQAAVATAKVNIPVHSILPHLASRKITIKWGKLLPFSPANVLRSPLPPFPDQQPIVLPLDEVIPAIPPDMLSVSHEAVISADDPELGKLPTLIDDES